MTDATKHQITPGAKVRHRDNEEEGDIVDVLPFYGSFGDGPGRVLFDVAVVKWKGTRQRTVVRVEDLIKLN